MGVDFRFYIVPFLIPMDAYARIYLSMHISRGISTFGAFILHVVPILQLKKAAGPEYFATVVVLWMFGKLFMFVLGDRFRLALEF